ncbi:hypothetical protein D9611_007865 [Ephemerocybe angulata]|uniref:Oxysterol-binding protein n=1 Tax=Ephemerocybe angulata TaxID=980116 RepID=A0A8H5FKA6_9AGAR|nr:hypothetical protein D9611_007865 [Tulosesus angulatus]
MSSKDYDDQAAPAVAVADSGDTGEGGKVKMIVSLVKKCLGVKDIASMRLSLPASLLEPIPNLEFSHSLDRPDLFAAINDSEDPFERMLALLRFYFAKDLKHVHGKVCKPYNSVLGEHFRAHWDVVPLAYPEELIERPSLQHERTSDAASILSGKTASFKSTASVNTADSDLNKEPSTAPTSPEPAGPSRIRVVYLTEQVSHHPPVSAYYASCPARHIEMQGIDQISAKVSGTTLRIQAGQYNQGIYVRLNGGPGEGEEYHITHPVASVNGILRGNFYLTMCDSIVVSCTNDRPSSKHGGFPRFRAIIEYKEESWLGRAHFLVEGVIFVVHDGETEHEGWTKVKQVPQNRVAAVLDGTWKGHIRWKRVGALSYPHTTSSSASSPSPSHVQLPKPELPSASASRADILTSADGWQTLIDVNELQVVPKEVRPLDQQHPFESRKLWRSVTEKLINKEYSDATKEKMAIEQKQRDDAAERKRNGVEFVPAYFEKGLDRGYSELTEEGRKAVEQELAEPSPFSLEGAKTAS